MNFANPLTTVRGSEETIRNRLHKINVHISVDVSMLSTAYVYLYSMQHHIIINFISLSQLSVALYKT